MPENNRIKYKVYLEGSADTDRQGNVVSQMDSVLGRNTAGEMVAIHNDYSNCAIKFDTKELALAAVKEFNASHFTRKYLDFEIL